MTALSETAEYLRSNGARVDSLEDDYGGYLLATLAERTLEVHMNFDDDRKQVLRMTVQGSTDCALLARNVPKPAGEVALLLLQGLDVMPVEAPAPRWYERFFKRKGAKS